MNFKWLIQLIRPLALANITIAFPRNIFFLLLFKHFKIKYNIKKQDLHRGRREIDAGVPGEMQKTLFHWIIFINRYVMGG